MRAGARICTSRRRQDAIGLLQYRLAIDVARAYLERRIDAIQVRPDLDADARERAIFDAIRRVVAYASEDAAKKKAERYGIHLADAIPAWRIESPAFWEKQWPHLRQRMSPEYANRCEAGTGRASQDD